MTRSTTEGIRILGTLEVADGKGIVRMQDRFDTDVDDLWSALTDPRRLARWLGEVEGDLRPGGEFRAHFFASGWEGTGSVESCEAPKRLRVRTTDSEQREEHSIEATLDADGGATILVIEERGMPVDHLAAYGAGIQIHIEDLGAYLGGRDRVPAERWEELQPLYQERAPQLS